MRKLHAPHQGTEKTSSRTCKLERRKQRHRRDNQVLLHMPRITEQPTKGAPQPDLTPPRAWHTVGTDVFHLADYYSKYNFVRKIPKGQSNSSDTREAIFNEQTIPKVVRSEYGHQHDEQALL